MGILERFPEERGEIFEQVHPANVCLTDTEGAIRVWEEIKLEWTGFNGAGDPFKENVAQNAIIVRTCKVDRRVVRRD